jgi:hypothetical protein
MRSRHRLNRQPSWPLRGALVTALLLVAGCGTGSPPIRGSLEAHSLTLRATAKVVEVGRHEKTVTFAGRLIGNLAGRLIIAVQKTNSLHDIDSQLVQIQASGGALYGRSRVEEFTFSPHFVGRYDLDISRGSGRFAHVGPTALSYISRLHGAAGAPGTFLVITLSGHLDY